MRKQEKLEMYVSKGLTKEEAEELIAYNCEEILSIEQLRVKFNYPEMGKGYPNWITPEEHMKICFKTAKEQYSTEKFGELGTETVQDLAVKLYIYSAIRLNKISSPANLKTALINICKNYKRQNAKRKKMWSESLDTPVPTKLTSTEEQFTKYDFLSTNEDVTDSEKEVVDCIRSIKNKEVRDVLVIAGYLLANINGLYTDYRYVLDTCNETIKQNLLQLAESVFSNEENEKKHKIDFNSIIKAFGADYFGDYKSCKNIKSEIQEYLVNFTNIISPCKQIISTYTDKNGNEKRKVFNERCIN